MSCGLRIFFWCQQREGNFPSGSLKRLGSSLSDLTRSHYAFFWSQLPGRCSAQLLPWDNSTFPRKAALGEKWSLLFPKDISFWELPGEAELGLAQLKPDLFAQQMPAASPRQVLTSRSCHPPSWLWVLGFQQPSLQCRFYSPTARLSRGTAKKTALLFNHSTELIPG